MVSDDFNVTRRKFITLSSAAIAASPFLFNITGRVPSANAAEKNTKYAISTNCIGCHYCFHECPESAIHWGDDKYMIDQDKCIQCGTCAKVCNICAAHVVQ